GVPDGLLRGGEVPVPEERQLLAQRVVAGDHAALPKAGEVGELLLVLLVLLAPLGLERLAVQPGALLHRLGSPDQALEEELAAPGAPLEQLLDHGLAAERDRAPRLGR